MLYPVTLKLVDAWGRTTKRGFLFDDISIASAVTNLGLFATAYQDVTELQVIESRVSHVNTHSGAPVATANRDEGGTFSVALDTPGKLGSVQVPGIIRAARVMGGTIDLTNADIVAYMAFYESGLVTASDGETVDHFVRGILDS